MKKVPGAFSWGPLLTSSPRAVPEFPNGQLAPALKSQSLCRYIVDVDLLFSTTLI
ncbi:unnamed protein product [Staurois parvus]|uniref:Uncharacterized protein n=1 Tax=Staurois parvus TaxID=386267 RepID=A0ABN9H982_9NEOB|nr:unnamed protein product [Staurois parvus]